MEKLPEFLERLFQLINEKTDKKTVVRGTEELTKGKSQTHTLTENGIKCKNKIEGLPVDVEEALIYFLRRKQLRIKIQPKHSEYIDGMCGSEENEMKKKRIECSSRSN